MNYKSNIKDKAEQLRSAAEALISKAKRLETVAADPDGSDDNNAALIAAGYGCGVALALAYTKMTELTWLLDSCPRARDKPALSSPEAECDLYYDDDHIVVRVPPLWSRFGSSRGRERYDRAYHYFYSDAVRTMMQALPTTFRCERKNISIVTVYPTTAKHIPDADNYDTKSITDAIADHLDFGDRWDACTFYRQNTVDDALPAGTYFIVSRGLDAPPTDELYSIIANFRR